MRRFLVFSILCFLGNLAFAQVTQTLRGTVVDSDTKFPLKRARVFLLSDSTARGIVTDSNGNFKLDNVMAGRHTLKVQHSGHITKILNNVVVYSSKETVLYLKLQVASFSESEETTTMNRSGEGSNEMAMVSVREFTVDETVRYAGSRGDPIRTALNFAGVQGLDDSRNDIVVRGNSPYALAIQVDGVNLMNSNHFATPGTNGGPLSKISFKCIDNSEFYSGSMPAEFGNSTSGVFDLKLKTGNNQKHEQGIYVGVLGADVFAEGPLNREKGSSYIFNYRYSLVSTFLNLGLDLGTSSIPFYQDLNFKFNFPKKNGGELSFWGITGNSTSDIILSDDVEVKQELYGDNDRDQYNETGLDVIGLTLNRPINERTFLKATIAYSLGYVYGNDNYIVSRDTLSDGGFNPEGVVTTPMLNYKFDESKWTLNATFNRRFGTNKLLKVGFISDFYNLSYIDSVRIISDPNWTEKNDWFKRWNGAERHSLQQYFAQFKQEFGQKFQATLGLHGTIFSLGKSASLVEPRFGLRYNYAAGKTLSLGGGLYSQMQPPYLHFYNNYDLGVRGNEINKNLGLTKSWHASMGHSWNLNPKLKLNAETYYQYLFNIPIENNPSAFSLINAGAGFSRVFANELVNEGTAFNYGLELTLERFFDHGYSYMINGTLYQSKYTGSDGVLRNTNFNGNYMFNALATKEFKVSEMATFGIGTNITYAGGRRYGIIDEEKSALAKDLVWKNQDYNVNKYKDYFRTDIRINYIINRHKTTHEIAFDLINVFSTNNVLEYAWAPGLDPNNPNNNFSLRQQIGFLPLFYYKLDF